MPHFNSINLLLFVSYLFASNLPSSETKPLVLAKCKLYEEWILCRNISNVTSFSLDNYTDPVAGPRRSISISNWPQTTDKDRASISGLNYLPGNAFRGLKVSSSFFTQRFLWYAFCTFIQDIPRRANMYKGRTMMTRKRTKRVMRDKLSKRGNIGN